MIKLFSLKTGDKNEISVAIYNSIIEISFTLIKLIFDLI